VSRASKGRPADDKPVGGSDEASPSESVQSAVAPTQSKAVQTGPKRSLWWRLSRAPVIVGTAMLASIGSLVVTLFAPGIVETLQNSSPVKVIIGPVVAETKTEFKGVPWKEGLWAMVTPRRLNPADAPPPGSSCDDARAWITELGGASLERTELKMLVQGQKTSGVILRGLQAKILERTEPLKGAMVVCPSAGTIGTTGIGFDLDSPNPVARTITSAEDEYPIKLGEPYFDNYSVTLAKGEPVEFVIQAATSKSFVRWVIEMVIVVDGSERTVTAGDSDGFRTSAITIPSEFWEWDWSRSPQDLVKRTACPVDPTTYC
jgi:hypothetical protein